MESEKSEEYQTGRAILKFLDGRVKIMSVPIIDGHWPATIANKDYSEHFHAVDRKKDTIIYEECNGQEE